MIRNAFHLFSCLVLLLAPAAARGEAPRSEKNYRYESAPLNGFNPKKEFIDMQVSRGTGGFYYAAENQTPSGLEKIEMDTDETGQPVSVRRTISEDEKRTIDRMWRENGKAYLQKNAETGGTVRAYDLSAGKGFAVDGSLLLMFRSFPFGSGKTWSVYMIDFSGASITITVRQAGTENVSVPAGVFSCYRMEGVVDLPLIHPPITYWIAEKEPHFLVKSIGKRGPFTVSYVISLIPAH